MDLLKIIQDLRQERDKLDTIILSLQQLASAAPARARASGNRRGRRSMDAAGRLEVSRRMKRYWEKRRKDDEVETGAG